MNLHLLPPQSEQFIVKTNGKKQVAACMAVISFGNDD